MEDKDCGCRVHTQNFEDGSRPLVLWHCNRHSEAHVAGLERRIEAAETHAAQQDAELEKQHPFIDNIKQERDALAGELAALKSEYRAIGVGADCAFRGLKAELADATAERDRLRTEVEATIKQLRNRATDEPDFYTRQDLFKLLTKLQSALRETHG